MLHGLPIISNSTVEAVVVCVCGCGVCCAGVGRYPRDALDGKGPQRRPQKRLGRRLEEVAEAVGGGYCRLQMPLALGVGGTVAGHRLGALERGRGGGLPMNPCNTPRMPSQAQPPTSASRGHRGIFRAFGASVLHCTQTGGSWRRRTGQT